MVKCVYGYLIQLLDFCELNLYHLIQKFFNLLFVSIVLGKKYALILVKTQVQVLVEFSQTSIVFLNHSEILNLFLREKGASTYCFQVSISLRE